ncbi:MAG: exodeoxyribonuclease VII large subunit [archaeon GW2011_AR6]|nr:MAG: exodeoxyribonuclease VII large subunit [archaeon GW2011_AR6]
MTMASHTETKVYSVDEITTHIKNLLEKDVNLQNVFVKGEVSNFRNSDSGHIYFSLKDETSIIECAMFRRANRSLEFIPENGIKIILKGSVDLYKPRGKYQLIVEELHLTGDGELYLKFLKLKSKLEKEGLFKESHKKLLPKYPKSIGIVTSPQGAVVHDIIKVVKRRYSHVRIVIYPSLVQGDKAKYDLVRGIEVLNNLNFEVIILARGGGSFEEIWPFNEEIVARAIYNSKAPVVSAIGHETDFTIADFVADKRAPTPSVAAEIIVPDEKEILKEIIHLEKRLYKQTQQIFEIKKQTIWHLMSRPIIKKPWTVINTYKQKLDEETNQLRQATTVWIKAITEELKGMNGRLNALSPYAVLDRGYSITMKKEKIISDIKDINIGDDIYTIIKSGKIKSEVQSKNGE